MSKSRVAVIHMDYPGSIISVNHYKYNKYYTKPETQAWMDELGWKIKGYHLEEWKLPLKVTCNGVFKDKRSTPDMSNLSKVVLDALQDASKVNDRDMRWHDGWVVTKRDCKPALQIIIEEVLNENITG